MKKYSKNGFIPGVAYKDSRLEKLPLTWVFPAKLLKVA